MDKQYKDLSSRACRGDNDALHELFDLAGKHEASGDFQKSTEIFRDAAIAYRITASRNGTNAESAEGLVRWLEMKEVFYRTWIEKNPGGMRELPYPASGITSEDIRRILIDELLQDESFSLVFSFLNDSLTEMDTKFSSPGHSLQRQLWGLLIELFGLRECTSRSSQCFQNIAVRIGLDILAHVIMKRCQDASDR